MTVEHNRVRFGVFEVDRQTRELRKQGVQIQLEDQPFEVLAALLDRPGDLVTRSELQARVWHEGTFVDFDKGLTKAVNKIRTALCDSATTPRYIQTLSRRGYRFIAPVEMVDDGHASVTESRQPAAGGAAVPSRRLPSRVRTVSIVAGVIGMLAVTFGLGMGRLRDRMRAFTRVPRIESLAVLPMQNLSGDATQEYFTDGFTDELIGNLAKIGSLRVISRTSVMRYKGSKKAVPEIARELRVDGVVEGSVRRSGDHVRINVALVHAGTAHQLWANGYEGNASEAVRLQAQITLAVAREISARLTAETRSRLDERGPTNPRAYDAYLRGRYLWNQRGAEAITEAVGHFEQALQEDPKFALAYSGLADCYNIGWGANQNHALAAEYARKAIALEPNLAEAHVSLGFAHQNLFQFADAGRELKRGIELNPGYVTAHQFHAIHLLTVGRALEALAENDRALRLDPFSLPVNNLRGYILVGLRQYDRAIEHLQVAAELAPEALAPHEQLARIYWIQQRGSDALAAEREVARRSHREFLVRGQAEVEAAYAKSGFRAGCLKSVQLKERVHADFPRPPGTGLYGFMIPLQYACLQDKSKVLEWLDQLLKGRGYGTAMQLETAPELDFMRSDSRFRDLVRRIGLPP